MGACADNAESNQVRRILSIDGGGIKGALPAAFLASVEERTGLRIVDQFDLIAGTSTGGIIALGLGMGIPAADILQFYKDHGPIIFHNPKGIRELKQKVRWLFRHKCDSSPLQSALTKIFGDKILGQSETRLVIPAYQRDRQAIRVFKTAHHPRLEIDHRETVVNVALATAAAPYYLPAHRPLFGGHLLDGGIWANNPVGLATVEAVGLLGWAKEGLRILSLGCTDETMIFRDDRAGIANICGGEKAVKLMHQGQSHAALGTAMILTGHPHDRRTIWRYSPKVPEHTFSLDDVTQIDRLISMGMDEAREALPEMRRIFLIGMRDSFKPMA